MRVIAALLCIVLQAWTVNANVEKTIFLGPGAVTLPEIRPSLDDLHLQSLSSLDFVLPTQLAVQFPSIAEPHGLASWYLLSDLEEGRRYEVRICWPATVSWALELPARAHTDIDSSRRPTSGSIPIPLLKYSIPQNSYLLSQLTASDYYRTDLLRAWENQTEASSHCSSCESRQQRHTIQLTER
jgi:hypothetical protein